ncbi:unnamed protein product, partial [Acanthoscelides obtectus]
KYFAATPANTTYAQVTASGSDNTTAKKFIQELIPDIAQIIDQQVKKAVDEVIKTSLSIYLPSTSSERRPMRRDQGTGEAEKESPPPAQSSSQIEYEEVLQEIEERNHQVGQSRKQIAHDTQEVKSICRPFLQKLIPMSGLFRLGKFDPTKDRPRPVKVFSAEQSRCPVMH